MTSSKLNQDDGQPRAKVGGEFGANGEWYEGGKFIATKDKRKQSPVKREYTEEETAEYLERKAKREFFELHHHAWLEAKRLQHKNLIDYLISNTSIHEDHVWMDLVKNYCAGFYPSLGWEFHQHGYLSSRQAEFACKAIYNRRNKKNSADWDALSDSLVEKFNPENIQP